MQLVQKMLSAFKSLLPSPSSLKVFFIALLISHFSLLASHSENVFSVRINPVIELPQLSQFNIGVGGLANLDWQFLSFGKFNVGISAGAGFINMPVKTGDSFAFIDMSMGVFAGYRPIDRLVVNAGIKTGVYQFSMEENDYTKAFYSPFIGLDVYISPYFSLFAEGKYSYRVFSENSPFTSFSGCAGIRLNITELMGGRARIKIDKSRQYSIFPVSWAWYEDNPVADLMVTNEEQNAITDISLSFFMESYMGQPFSFARLPKLSKGESMEVPVTALFNEVMLGLSENINANGEVQVQYRSLGARKEISIPVQMPIFHRNTLSWDDDRRAAAFVSPRDSAARLFSRFVVSGVNLHLESGRASPLMRSVPKNVLYAASLFEALYLYGITYVVDPASSYVALSEDISALDSLNYPYETLNYRGGDCDDLSILFCSLLESLGIETAFMTVPGHIFMAFEIGDDSWMSGHPNIIETSAGERTKRWMPVEITVPDEGFSRAWRIGARQWLNQIEEADIFPIRECWEIYPPVTVSAAVDYAPEMPPVSAILASVENELQQIRQ